MRAFPETLRLVVTDQHIARGIPNNPNNCAIALAANDWCMCPGITAGVGTRLSFYDVKSRDGDRPVARYMLSRKAIDFTEVFDETGTAEPATFTLKRIL